MNRVTRFLSILALPVLAPSIAFAGDVIPAPGYAAERSASETATVSVGSESEYPAHAWELPAIQVRGKRVPELREEEHVGAYAQPRWTAKRRFPTTRIYVVPAGKMEFEWWLKFAAPFEAPLEGRKIESQYELEMGLGHRLQLDLYLVTTKKGSNGPFELSKEKVELRYALADWGEIWGNPTLYLEWIHQHNGPDAIEGKVLFGGEIGSGIHAGLNLVWERELGLSKANEYAIDAGLSFTMIDETLSLGAEVKIELVDVEGSRFELEQEYLVGPSLAYTPIPPMHLLLTPLFGIAKGDEVEGIFEILLITGWTF
jgi:hypothetical protein